MLGPEPFGVPSPKFHWYDAIEPLSTDPEPLNVTFNGAVPEVGFAKMTAVGGGSAPTVIVFVAAPVFPPLSVTVSVAVKLPEEL